jgi:hypothetical protein
MDFDLIVVGGGPAGMLGAAAAGAKGMGKQALKMLRPKFEKISVSEIYDYALPFWIKMKERGLINNLGSVKTADREYAD